MRKLRVVLYLAFVAGLMLSLLAEYSMKRFAEGLYLSQIENEAGMVRVYARILRNRSLSSDQKLTSLSNLNNIHISSVAGQMDLVFHAYHKNLPSVWDELSSYNKSAIFIPSTGASNLKAGTTN
jgi:hypothetical protein